MRGRSCGWRVPFAARGLLRTGGWCFALLIVLSFPGPRAWADAGKDRADVLCGMADKTERDAREAERKSEAQRSSKGSAGNLPGTNTLSSGDAAAIRQSVKAKTAQTRAILPQIRQAMAAATQDKGIVPGLGQYLGQMEGNISRVLQAVDSCLDSPGTCSVPSISCPPPPGIPAINNVSGSNANLVRQIQQDYAQAGDTAQQACQKLNVEIMGDVERLKRESGAAGTKVGLSGSSLSPGFGGTDLYLRTAERMKREASQYRLEADRVAGVTGYCGTRSQSRVGAETPRAPVADSRNDGTREGSPETGPRAATTVLDLKTAWDKQWSKGRSLDGSDVPLPMLSGGEKYKAIISDAKGEFYFLTKDGRKITGKDGVPLEADTKVVTGSNGKVRMILPDQTTFTVGPNSDMVLDKFVYDSDGSPKTIMVNLAKGVFRWVTGKTHAIFPRNMNLTTPAFSSGIRGTDFETTVNPDGTGQVMLYFGQLEITGNKTGISFMLNQGEKVTFGADGSFSRPMKVE